MHHHVSFRLLAYLFELMKYGGIDLATALPPHLQRLRTEMPEWVKWADYRDAAQFVGEQLGVEGIGRAGRAAIPDAYAELRSMSGLFRDPIPYFRFLNETLMQDLNPCAPLSVEELPDGRLRLRNVMVDGLEGTRWFFHGTVMLVQIFPTHCGLTEEAKVEVLELTDQNLDAIVTLPPPKSPWSTLRSSTTEVHLPPFMTEALSPREQDVMKLICEGLTNAEIGDRLQTSSNTVKNQISSILEKVGATNRTELAVVALKK